MSELPISHRTKAIRFVRTYWFDTNHRALAAFRRCCKQNDIKYSARKCRFLHYGDSEITWYFLSQQDYNLLKVILPQHVQDHWYDFLDRQELSIKTRRRG